MAKNGTSQTLANKILSDVSPNAAFWVHNGSIIRSIHEMIPALESMNDDTFRHHVNQEKNDFSNWIKDILHDKALSKELSKVSTRKKTILAIKNRIAYLEDILYTAKEEEHGLKKPSEARKIFSFKTKPVPQADKSDELGMDLGEISGIPKVPPQAEESMEMHEHEILEPPAYHPEEAVEKIEPEQSTHLEQIKQDILEETYRKIAFEKLMNRILFFIIGLIAGILIGIYFVK